MDQRHKYFRASGGVYTTTADYARFLTMWMNGGRLGDIRLLSRATVEAALRPGADRGNGQTYAMHWTVFHAETASGMPAVFGHGGSDGTLALAFPTIHAAVLYFTQSRFHDERGRFRSYLGRVPPFDDFVTSERKPEIERQWEEIRSQYREQVRIPPSQLKRYVGSYDGSGMKHEVLVREDTLFYRVPEDSTTVTLRPVAPHVFIGHDACMDYLFRVTFEPAEDGTINGYVVDFVDRGSEAFRRR